MTAISESRPRRLPIHRVPRSLWKSIRHTLEEYGCRLLSVLIPLLPRQACIRLADFVGNVAASLDHRGRAVARENLECVFGTKYQPAERDSVIRASYRNFARTMLDLFWIQQLTASSYQEWITFEGFDAVIERRRIEGRGIIFMCVHQGNWEWANLGSGFLGFRNVTVVQTFKNARLIPVFRKLREHSGPVIIHQDRSLLRMLKVAKNGGSIALLIDLTLRPNQAAGIVESFKGIDGSSPAGLEICAPILHSAIAQRTGALLVPVETRPDGDGRVHVIAHPPMQERPGETVTETTQRCWDFFEAIIRSRPQEYLWAYKHFRYRPRNAVHTYPSYSNRSAEFEKLRLKGHARSGMIRELESDPQVTRG